MTTKFEKNGKQFNFAIIETENELRQNQDVIDLLDKLAIQAFEDHNKKLEADGGKVINMPKKENLWKPNDNWIKSAFGTEENRKIFVIKDEDDKAVQVSIALFNNENSRKKNWY